MNVHLYIFVKFQLFYEKISLPNKWIFFFFLTLHQFSQSHFLYFGKPRFQERKKQGLELNSHSEIRKSLFLAGALTDFLLVLELIHHLCGTALRAKVSWDVTQRLGVSMSWDVTQSPLKYHEQEMYMVTQKQCFSLTDIFPYVSCPSFLSFFSCF